MATIATLAGAPARFPGGLREVAPRTWAWLQPNGGLGESNAGLVVGNGASLLVDTLWDERLTRRMLDAMTPVLADAPLRQAFITHPDGDHWWGNAALPPDVEIVALPACDRAMRGEAPPRVLNGMTAAASVLSRVPGRVGAVARRGHAQVAPFQWRGVRLRHADRTIEDGAALDVGGRRAHVIDVGPTHTAADAIVHVPDVGVVFAADILFIGVMPIMWHGPVETWLAALDTLLSLDAGVYVPGHGPPCGRAEIEELAAYWRWLSDGVREQRAAGRSASEAAQLLVRSDEHRRWAAWEGPERIVVSVATMYRNLDGGPAEVKPPVRARLLVQTMALGQELAAQS
ncbi:MAG TPA: MBL fold metallo-hydrolase [Conexibacter sp.]|jgi:glyoxylase-like metal-dependent hydrolase (beta-lactamase superfamily II)|nr:MBL fold metallo-hydrolase [Conexibacter sp.]